MALPYIPQSVQYGHGSPTVKACLVLTRAPYVRTSIIRTKRGLDAPPKKAGLLLLTVTHSANAYSPLPPATMGRDVSHRAQKDGAQKIPHASPQRLHDRQVGRVLHREGEAETRLIRWPSKWARLAGGREGESSIEKHNERMVPAKHEDGGVRRFGQTCGDIGTSQQAGR